MFETALYFIGLALLALIFRNDTKEDAPLDASINRISRTNRANHHSGIRRGYHGRNQA